VQLGAAGVDAVTGTLRHRGPYLVLHLAIGYKCTIFPCDVITDTYVATLAIRLRELHVVDSQRVWLWLSRSQVSTKHLKASPIITYRYIAL
jgi:hypothetical protein